ncbi:MAG: alpha/beta hydrolase [archaeon]|nr:alpha/beta hydrolase [archaeon]
MKDNMNNCAMQLKDGRKFSYSESGEPNGKPIFFLHGIPGSRLDYNIFKFLNLKMKARIITPDRPGLGLSTFQSKRQVLDFPNDLNELADHLGLEKYSLLGYSAGGAYALACIFKYPSRIYKCGLVGSIGPKDFNPPIVKRIKEALLLRFIIRIIKKKNNDIKLLENFLVEKLPLFFPFKEDRKLLTSPDFSQERKATYTLTKTVMEYASQGKKGPLHESFITSRPWGFKIRDIIPEIPIHIWHGEEDGNVNISSSKLIQERLPHCETNFLPGEGHMTIWENHGEKILEKLIS